MKHTVSALVFGLSILCSATSGFAAEDGPAAKVADLAWMSGQYEGVGGNDGSIAEVYWTQPKGGSIAEFIRITKGDVTTIVEMLVIHEQGGSLVLHQQRCNPCSKVQSEPLQMKLIEIGKDKVVFEAVGKSALKTVGYRREGDKIIVTGTFPQGGKFDAPLIPKKQ